MIDLLVAGGGPAGLATALYGAQAGLDVAVVERRSGVLDKACGEGMMPHTVAHLDRLGVTAEGQAAARDQLYRRRPPGQRAVQKRRGARCA